MSERLFKECLRKIIMPQRKKAFLISGLPGVGKTSVSRELAKKFEWHHIVFIKKLAASPEGRKSALKALKRLALTGRQETIRQAGNNQAGSKAKL
ncbi:hypothetical protein HZB89_01160 [archaeon]|nr:hypothetical protein [archaeon]